jgi:hypothetical protein
MGSTCSVCGGKGAEESELIIDDLNAPTVMEDVEGSQNRHKSRNRIQSQQLERLPPKYQAGQYVIDNSK